MRAGISPRDFAEAIGVSESSVKRWVDQGVLRAARTAGGHRRIAHAEAMRFIREQHARLVRPDKVGLEPIALAMPREGSLQHVAADLFVALADGHAPAARAIMLGLHLAGHSVAKIADDVIRPAMARLGLLWRDGLAGVFVEHRATDICRVALDELRQILPAPVAGLAAIVAAPAGDPYLIAPLLVSLSLTELGWCATCLGPDTPLSVLTHAVRELSARLVCISMTTEPTEARIRELEAFIAGSRGCAIALGGQSIARLPWQTSGQVFVGADLTALAEFVQRL